MKKFTLLFITIFWGLFISASPLILIETGSMEITSTIFTNNGLTIHYYADDFIIATKMGEYAGEHHILDQDAFSDPQELYYLLWLDKENKSVYLEDVSEYANILYRAEDFIIISVRASMAVALYPSVHGGMVRISEKEAKLPYPSSNYERGGIPVRADIWAMLAEVSQDTLQTWVQHLQDYGTRNAYSSQAVLAQNWIYDKFESFGLDVELHDFTMPGGAASDNIIATLTGTVYPDEYVVLGAHYDSYSFSGAAPGADDNATGTAGILEAARIMSQYTFDRTIIFAAWSGEEYGLIGSDAWATEAAASGMNILGYFNMDMAGYLEPGNIIHTDIIAPASANELRQFYKDVCEIYLPDFGVFDGALSGGDSDHTSFNQNGYMGIFPFEDSQNYSPYIHTSNDIIGPSVNNFEMHATFTKAIIANTASLADLLPAPSNLAAIAGDAEVSLSWSVLDSVDYYNIYRNDDSSPFDTSQVTHYTDQDVVNGTAYTYSVTAVFTGSGEESGHSNEVTVIPMPPIALPFFDDYETGGPYWTFEQSWGLTESIFYSSSHSMTESPTGNYQPNMNSSATLRAIDFTGATSAQISFWTRYRIQSGYDHMYLEVSTNGIDWDLIDSYTGNQLAWGQKSYSLDDYAGQPNVIIRFRFYSDSGAQEQGMYIDDLEINVDGVGITGSESHQEGLNVKLQPNPSDETTTVSFYLDETAIVKISLMNNHGQMVKEILSEAKPEGRHHVEFEVKTLVPGTYYCVVESGSQRITRKLMVTH